MSTFYFLPTFDINIFLDSLSDEKENLQLSADQRTLFINIDKIQGGVKNMPSRIGIVLEISFTGDIFPDISQQTLDEVLNEGMFFHFYDLLTFIL